MISTIEKIFKFGASFPGLKEISSDLSEKEKSYFLKKIELLNKNSYKLYKSKIHGIYHSEKVMLFAFLIGLEQKLNPVDMEILLDAAAYHDVGRQNDSEDEFHGYSSTIKYERSDLFNFEGLPVYQDEENFKILKAITDCHSRSDERMHNSFENFEISLQNSDRYEKLAKILKDADALDRERFNPVSSASLNPEMLRFEVSKKLIKFAKLINLLYIKLNKVAPDVEQLKSMRGTCLHSIGSEFYKIPSILNNGILSLAKAKEHFLVIPKNFKGGNGDSWISVIPAQLYKEIIGRDNYSPTACVEFLKRGIIFVCNDQIMYEPLSNKRRFEAIEKSLPYDKSGYDDERYVHEQISSESIIAIAVLKEYGTCDIRSIKYLYNVPDVIMLEDKLNYIFSNIDYNQKNDQLTKLLDNYSKVLDEYNLSKNSGIDYEQIILPKKLNPILDEINVIVADLIYKYYCRCVGKNEITVCDAVEYELSKANYDYDLIKGEIEYVFLLNLKKDKKKALI